MPAEDVSDAARLANEAAAILLRISAYDYALAGTLAGERARTVPVERYAAVARDAARAVSAFTSSAVAVAAPAKGPRRERLVALADRIAELGREVVAYADGSDPATLARVVAAVADGWDRLADLAAALPPDQALARTIARGRSFVVRVTPERVYALGVGPFSSAAEAEAAARRIGQVESVSRAAPFGVRVGTYAGRAAADAAAAALGPKGFVVSSVTEEQRFTFARGGPPPDVELWREPARVFDTPAEARRLAISPDGAWLATGSDDGTIAIFSADGTLRALPKFVAGVTALAFSDDGRFLMGGAATLANLLVPSGVAVGFALRLTSPADQVVFVPAARAFAAAARGPTGEPGGGGGVIGGRAPDGAVLGSPFPITTPASGAVLAASEAGELYVATAGAGAGGTDIEVFRVGVERSVRGVVKIPGSVRALALDRSGTRAAALSTQGVYRFGPRDSDPTRTLALVAPPARDIAFGADGTLYVLEASRITALDPAGTTRWTGVLVDGRRLVAASRAIVLDGVDRVLAVDGRGAVDELGVSGTVQDLVATLDGRRVGVLVDGRRAVLFTLP